MWRVLRAPSRSFGNLEGRIGGDDELTTLAQWIGKQFDPTLSWKRCRMDSLDLAGQADRQRHSRSRKMPTSRCKTGVDALIVSNHGGRQLDGAPAAIHALPRVVDAVGGRTEVLFDSGILTGQSLFKAVALGARAGLDRQGVSCMGSARWVAPA